MKITLTLTLVLCALVLAVDTPASIPTSVHNARRINSRLSAAPTFVDPETMVTQMACTQWCSTYTDQICVQHGVPADSALCACGLRVCSSLCVCDLTRGAGSCNNSPPPTPSGCEQFE